MMNMIFERKLTIPMEVKQMYPLSEKMKNDVAAAAEEARAVFTGASDKFLLIVGPCSADREDSVLDYLTRLRRVADEVRDRLLIIPRLYTGKPRSTAEGYKGIVHQPDPNEKPDMFRGIVLSRELHIRALSETGFSCADEMLYPENVKYLDDLLGYIAVGARSVEDQHHRLTASGLDTPVGMKNPTGGDLSVMMNAVSAAQTHHTFIYRGWEVHSLGNPYAHTILRGWTGRDGKPVPNYRLGDLRKMVRLYAEPSASGRIYDNPAVIVDCNHANSGKDPLLQPGIALDVLRSRRADPEVKKLCKGLMIESYLKDGAQDAHGTEYGLSITDPCLGWEKTERLIFEIADRV